MTEKEFEKLIESTINDVAQTLIIKGREYRRNENPFHNFEQGEKRSGRTREQVLDGFLLKHEISIADMTKDLAKGIIPKSETVHEKFNDNIIYLLIKKAMILEKVDKSKTMKQTEIELEQPSRPCNCWIENETCKCEL